MRVQTFLFAVLASLSFAAFAQSNIISKAHEVRVNELRLPGNIVGQVAFKRCKSCKMQVIRVTTETRYALDGRDVPLEELKKAVDAITDKSKSFATVIHHLKSNTVVAVRVFK